MNRILEGVCHTHIITVIDADDWGVDTRSQTFHLAQTEHFVLRCLSHVNSCNQSIVFTVTIILNFITAYTRYAV